MRRRGVNGIGVDSQDAPAAAPGGPREGARGRPRRARRLRGRDGARRDRGSVPARGGIRREARGGRGWRTGRRGPRRARRPEARRGGQGVGRDAREAGLRGDLRGGVPRLEARV